MRNKKNNNAVPREVDPFSIAELKAEFSRLRDNYYGDVWAWPISNGTKTIVEEQAKTINRILDRVKVLEDIVRKSGLITDFTPDEVSIREDHTVDYNGNVLTTKLVPYQINEIKVK